MNDLDEINEKELLAEISVRIGHCRKNQERIIESNEKSLATLRKILETMQIWTVTVMIGLGVFLLYLLAPILITLKDIIFG